MGSSDHSVDFIASCQVSSDHRENSCLVTYPITEWCQETPSISRFAVNGRLAYYNRDYITPMLFEHLSDCYCVVNFKATLDTVTGGDGNRDGLVMRPRSTHCIEYFQGKTHTMLQVSTIFILSMVGEGGYEAC